MRWHVRIPRLVGSTVEAGPARSRPVLDGSDVVVPNRWKLPAHSVALLGRPAVWTAFDIATPSIAFGPLKIEARRFRWEQDFGGHLFLAVTGEDTTHVTIVEAGPLHPGGTGALVPYCYPEDDFAQRGVVDFEPVLVPPPSGLDAAEFAELVRAAQRAYDGNQRYIVIELPFLRVGRDSNSYTVGVLLYCGVDPRNIPRRPAKATHVEWTGYPGAEDPVQRANFGSYFGAPAPLLGGAVAVAHHNEDGSVRLVVVGGTPNSLARLPDATEVRLDALGRIALSAERARRHALPITHTSPPGHISFRPRFPASPAAAGAYVTLIVNGTSTPLVPGAQFRGTIVDRHDALGLATLRTAAADVVLPLAELGVELRDPKRVDALLHVGNELTVGLHHDRHPKLHSHGAAALDDAVRWHRFHLPRRINVATAGVGAAAVLLGAFIVWRRLRS